MNCPNCFNKYSEEIYIPRILNNCGHTICEVNIKRLKKKIINFSLFYFRIALRKHQKNQKKIPIHI